MAGIALQDLTWLNPPLAAEIAGGSVAVKTRGATDFWQGTFYGFHRDSGHFLHTTVSGDFTATVTIAGRFETLYDQAGLMVRSGPRHWVKSGIELTDGELYISTVVTNGQSDWSVTPYRFAADDVTIRMTRHGETIRVQYRDPRDGRWIMTRLGYFEPAESLQIGLMCCSPEREGFEVVFRNFELGPPIDRALHAP